MDAAFSAAARRPSPVPDRTDRRPPASGGPVGATGIFGLHHGTRRVGVAQNRSSVLDISHGSHAVYPFQGAAYEHRALRVSAFSSVPTDWPVDDGTAQVGLDVGEPLRRRPDLLFLPVRHVALGSVGALREALAACEMRSKIPKLRLMGWEIGKNRKQYQV